MQTKLATLLKPVSNAIAFIYVPVMWIMAIVHAVLGVVGVLSPGVARGQVNLLNGSGKMRLFGFYVLVAGIFVFSQAGNAEVPILVQTIAVVLFLCGGTLIAIPALGMIFVEWMLDKGPSFFRVVALLNIVVALLFYLAAQLEAEKRPETDEMQQDEGSVSRDVDDEAAPKTQNKTDIEEEFGGGPKTDEATTQPTTSDEKPETAPDKAEVAPTRPPEPPSRREK